MRRILRPYREHGYESKSRKNLRKFFLFQNQNQKLQENSEKLETELLCLKTAEVNGILGVDDDDSLSTADDPSGGNGGVYKQRYERAVRELEFTKRRLQQQHHDDLEQLIALRKQLEKKVGMGYNTYSMASGSVTNSPFGKIRFRTRTKK